MFRLLLDSFQRTIALYCMRGTLWGLSAAGRCSSCYDTIVRSEQAIFLLNNVGYASMCKTYGLFLKTVTYGQDIPEGTPKINANSESVPSVPMFCVLTVLQCQSSTRAEHYFKRVYQDKLKTHLVSPCFLRLRFVFQVLLPGFPGEVLININSQSFPSLAVFVYC